MRSSWPALRAQLVRSTTTLSFQRQFRATCDPEPTLAGFADPAALLDFMHGPIGDPVARNAVLAALVRRAQAGLESAVSLLLLTLWPGLDAAHCRLARHFRGDPEILVSDLIGRMVDGIHALDLGRVNRIAATLIRNCERDVMRALQRAWAERERRRGVPDPETSMSRKDSCFGLPEDADAAAARLVDVLAPEIGEDARLVVAIAVVGARQEAAAAALGLSHDAGRKRYQRALRRLRLRFEEI